MSTGINLDYKNISEELFKVKVFPEGTCDIYTNVTDMIIYNWNNLTLNIIKKYQHIYAKLMDNVSKQSNYIDKLHNKSILSNIQLFLPENYDFIKKEIIAIWINIYRIKLQLIYNEDKFDSIQYEPYSIDRKWAYTRMQNIRDITKQIDDYINLIEKNNITMTNI